MKNKIIYSVALLILVSLAASAETFMNRALGTWKDYPIDSVIKKLGFPADEKTIAGKHLFYWKTSTTNYVPASTTSTVKGNKVETKTTGGYSEEEYCTVTIGVDSNNLVDSWQYEGNDCPSFYLTGKSYVNPQNDVWAIKKAQKQKLKEERKREKNLYR